MSTQDLPPTRGRHYNTPGHQSYGGTVGQAVDTAACASLMGG